MGKEESNGTTEEKPSGSESSEGTKEQTSEEKKEDVEKLRTVIKVNEEESTNENNKEEPETKEPNSESKKEENPSQPEEKKEGETAPEKQKISNPSENTTTPSGSSREDLEQRRNMLQSIKDFDFQIKKNQEDIGKMNEKLDGLTKDLDDLVSLYEIVSEQMNPFVGLSKVTKKRIDALENFTQEIEDIKTRMGEVESVVEKGLGGIKKLTKNLDKKEPARIDNEKLIKHESEIELSEESSEETTSKNLEEKEVINENTDLNENDISSNLNVSNKETQNVEIPNAKVETTNEPTDQNNESDIKSQNVEISNAKVETTNEPTDQNNESVTIETTLNNTNDTEGYLSDNEFEKLLNKSLESLFAEQNIDNLINDFLLNLK